MKVKAYREPVNIDDLLGDMTLAKLHAIFRDIIETAGKPYGSDPQQIWQSQKRRD